MRRMYKLLLTLSLVTANIIITSVTIIFWPSNISNPSSEGCLFTFAQITDSQFTGSSPIFETTTKWLSEQNNLAFVVHTGDIVNSPFNEATWKNAYVYIHQLDNRCSWATLAGDDDIPRGNTILTNYQKYFGNSSLDQYYIIGGKLLFVLLSWSNVDGSISKERLEWMDKVIQDHMDLKVIVCLHPCLSNLPILNMMAAPNTDEIWNHIDKHENIILTLNGHMHKNWIIIHNNGSNKVWSISTEALFDKGYTRIFYVYKDRIEATAYSPWTNTTYTGPLDRFTINYNSTNNDADRDLWNDNIDIMPTHPLVPNSIITSITIIVAIILFMTHNKRLPNKKNQNNQK